jgi:hypothetical protein
MQLIILVIQLVMLDLQLVILVLQLAILVIQLVILGLQPTSATVIITDLIISIQLAILVPVVTQYDSCILILLSSTFCI